MNVLVLGKAKTGTTVISRTILHSLPEGAGYLFEPGDTRPFEGTPGEGGVVAKVLFDHWTRKKAELRDVAENKLPLRFDKLVVIRRDPRDELISILLYYPFNLKRLLGDDPRFATWAEYLRRKETAPASVSFLDMCRTFDSLFGVNFTPSLSRRQTIDNGYSRFCAGLRAPRYDLRYEDFMAGRTEHLAGYLGLELSARRDVGEAYGNTRRSASFDNWKRYFTPEDVVFFKRHADYLADQGYTDWELAPPASIPESELSGYVRSLLA